MRYDELLERGLNIVEVDIGDEATAYEGKAWSNRAHGPGRQPFVVATGPPVRFRVREREYDGLSTRGEAANREFEPVFETIHVRTV
jgi:hypothetical protein